MQLKLRTIAAALALLAPAAALAQATDCTEITAVPYKITLPGVYCLKSSVSGISGIQISADDVTVDLNGYTVSSSGSFAVHGHAKNSTVRNGTLRAGTYAVYLTDPGVSGALVERIRAERSGILVHGEGGVVRNSVVIGTASTGVADSYGITIANGTGMRVSDNLVVNPGAAFPFGSGGIYAKNTVGALIERNAISLPAPAPAGSPRYGIRLEASDGATAAGNRVVNMNFGIYNIGGTSLFVDNAVHGTGVPFFGGVMAGQTNYAF